MTIDSIDSLRYLQDKNHLDTRAFVDRENKYFADFCSENESIIQEFEQEMKGRDAAGTGSSTKTKAKNDFYWKKEAGEKRGRYIRTYDGAVVLDLNALDTGSHFVIPSVKLSRHNMFLAYPLDLVGDERYNIYIKDLSTLEIIACIPNTAGHLEFANDTALFYTAKNEHDNYQVHRFDLDCLKSTLVYTELDRAFRLYLRLANNQDALFCLSKGGHCTEYRYLSLKDPSNIRNEPIPLIRRESGHLYDVEILEDKLLIQTDGGGKYPNIAVLWCSVDSASKGLVEDEMEELIPYDSSVVTNDLVPFQNHILLLQRLDGIQQFKIIKVSSLGKELDCHSVKFDETVYFAGISDYNSLDFKSDCFQFHYESPLLLRLQ